MISAYIAFIVAVLSIISRASTSSTALPAHACALLDSGAYMQVQPLRGCVYSGHVVSYGLYSADTIHSIVQNGPFVEITPVHGG